MAPPPSCPLSESSTSSCFPVSASKTVTKVVVPARRLLPPLLLLPLLLLLLLVPRNPCREDIVASASFQGFVGEREYSLCSVSLLCCLKKKSSKHDDS